MPDSVLGKVVWRLRQIVWRLRLMMLARLPDKPVRRSIRGVPMTLPRAHGLPYFTRPGTAYLRNLVELGRSLAASEGSVCVLDIGANVGDTALVVLDQAPGSAVCVEPDPMWHGYLATNVGAMPNVAVEHSVLVGPATEQVMGLAIRRHPVGSSIVERTEAGQGLATITTTALLEKFPQLGDVRLVKSDTDGYDITLVDAVTVTFAASRPVVFFELDPRPTHLVMPEVVIADLWDKLVERGYERAVVWDNGGSLLGDWPVAEMAERSAVLDLSIQERGYGYWDVAVAHKDDPAGLAALDAAAAATRAR